MRVGDIQYEIKEGSVVFTYNEQLVILPIELGQGARTVIVAYLDKLQRGTAKVAPKTPYPDTDLVLQHFEDILYDSFKNYKINANLVATLNVDILRKMNPELKDAIPLLVKDLMAMNELVAASVFLKTRA